MASTARRAETEPSRLVDVHYRKLDREYGNFPDEISLAKALRQALQKIVAGTRLQDDVQKRVQNPVPGKPGDIRCWNNIRAEQGALFGTLCLYRPSELQAVIRARNFRGPVSAYPLDQIDEAGGRDFLRAIAYWMAVGDHFYLIQTPSIQTGAMENYFGWLLRKIGTLDKEKTVRMHVAFDRDAVGGDLHDLVSVNVGGAFEPPDHQALDDAESKFHPGAVEVVPGDQPISERRHVGKRPVMVEAWDLMRQVIHDQKTIEEIEDAYRKLRQADPNATLDVELDFFVHLRKYGSESGQEAKQRALHALASGLRDMPEGTVTARGKDGMIKGREIRLKAPRRIKLAPPPEGVAEGAHSSLLDLDHTFSEMQVVHRRFLEDGKIGNME